MHKNRIIMFPAKNEQTGKRELYSSGNASMKKCISGRTFFRGSSFRGPELRLRRYYKAKKPLQ
jgi:hypothetical protein